MALVAHTIYSLNDPRETQASSDALLDTDLTEEWVPSLSLQPQRPPPLFVKATHLYDDYCALRNHSSVIKKRKNDSYKGHNVATWYRALATSTGHVKELSPAPQQSNSPTADQRAPESSKRRTRSSEGVTKNNWFIMNSMQSQTPSTSRTPSQVSIADILTRDPPPALSLARYVPPVWLEIGPSNKGYTILQRSGWNEGEALGPDATRRPPVTDILSNPEMSPRNRKGKAKMWYEAAHSQSDADVRELQTTDVIDLTLSALDEDEGGAGADTESDKPKVDGTDGVAVNTQSELPLPPGTSAHGGRALLVPLATVLKSDRLGIGLKARTTGPFRASQKRITHNSAALAAHIGTSEAMRKRVKEYERGRRGFERQRTREEVRRKRLLAYLNS